MSAKAPKPPHQNPALPDFWDHRYRQGVTPWDAGQVPQALKDFVARQPKPLKVLIPGCGNAYEGRYLAQIGWPVVALDFSEAAVVAAREQLGLWADCAVQGDYFTWNPPWPLDVIYERAFLCALPRTLWPDYAARTAALLQPGALLAGFFFMNDELKGPPFGTSMRELNAMLGQWFECIENEPVGDSIPVFAGKERWQLWRRLPPPVRS